LLARVGMRAVLTGIRSGMDSRSELTSGAVKPIWLSILGCALAAALANFVAGIRFKPYEIAAVVLIVVVALGLAAFYTLKRPDDRIARLFRAAVELFLFSFLCGSLSYAVTSLDRPLWDGVFDAWDQALGFEWRYWGVFHAWDQALGFEWRYWLGVLDGYPKFNTVLVLAYHSMWPQLALVIVALVTIRDYRRLDVFLLAFGFTALVTVTIAGFMPALSPLAYFGITPSDHPHIMLAVPREFEAQALALRSGAMRVIELGGAQGLVTFPSFHTATAVILLLGFAWVPYVRWVSVCLNGLMLLSIPIEGSHYLVDVIAGVIVALLAWAAALAIVKAAIPLPSMNAQAPRGIAVGSS
jgi:hypothetical protein